MGFYEEPKSVPTRYGARTLQYGILGDPTGILRICAWEDNMRQFVEDDTYKITNLIIKKFDGNLAFNTTMGTKVLPITEMENVQTDVSAIIQIQISEAQLLHLDITKTTLCGNEKCQTPVTLNENDITVKCTKCNRKMSKNSIKSFVRGTLHLKIEGQKATDFIATNEILKNYATKNNLMELLSDLDRFEDALLEKGQFQIEFLSNSHILKRID